MGTNNKFWIAVYVSAAFVLVGSCSRKPKTDGNLTELSSALLQKWGGPYGGVPPWDQVQPQEFPAAFDRAIAEAQKEIEAIAKNPAAPTFENTFVAMEKSGASLNRLVSLFFVHTANLSTEAMKKIETEVVPKLTAYENSIPQNSALFERIAQIYKESGNLGAAEQRLVETTFKRFVRQGATLKTDQKARLSEINLELSKLGTKFSQNVLNDEQEKVTWIEKQGDLKGLDDSLVSGYAKAAKDLKRPGQWAVRNTRSAMEPFLTFSTNRALREKVWKTYYSRSDNGDKNDNNAIISKILSLRTERAKLLGYESHAHLILESRMAKTPDNAMDLMMQVWPKALKRANEEIADMQALADTEKPGLSLEPWDYRYYAEKVRKAKYDFKSTEVTPYLQLNKMIEAIHWMAKEVFDLTFTKVTDVPVFHPDVTVYKVTDTAGELVGLWYLDPYARDGKRSGAWMTDYRAQQNIDGKWITPIVSNNSNFVKTDNGKPVLITGDDATTLFHEFGHALHGLSSRVTYPSQAGTNVARDYVEFPSQLIEHWFPTEEVLSRFAVHYETGQSIPKKLLIKLNKAKNFNQGFGTVEFLAAALVDMKLHLSTNPIEPRKFEAETLADLGMPKQIVMRHRIPHFLHLFDHGYDAAYYSYLWSDALTADAAELFQEQKDRFYNKETAKTLIESIFSVGDTIDPAEGFRRFRGRDVDTKALLRKRGLPVD